MKRFVALTVADQFANHLRGEILAGVFGKTLPGVRKLAEEAGVSSRTAVAAVAQLEHEGLLEAAAQGRPHRITVPRLVRGISLKIGILHYGREELDNPRFLRIERALEELGHRVQISRKSLGELKMDVGRVAKLVAKNPADAWIVQAGSREIVEWFSKQPFPTFALFGVMSGIDIAGGSARKIPAMRLAVKRLVELGHRRIVLVTRREKREPAPALFERGFLEELEAHGIETGPYNLPDWGDGPSSLGGGLERLFRFTPPTAMLVIEKEIFLAVQNNLARMGIHAPGHISLIADDFDPCFGWMRPKVTHFDWNESVLLRGLLAWIRDVARGRPNRRKIFSDAVFVDGETIGAVPSFQVTHRH